MLNLGLLEFHQNTSTGWKKAAKVNCLVLSLMSMFLLGCLIAAASQAGGIQKALFFYEGDCDEDNVSRVNTVLHLLINVVSTLVLASSNFFMQVLNSPSREEVNTAHLKGSWLGIGVPSVRNVAHVSKFKTWSWVVLLLSSIPIHLLFNSTIFQADHLESEYHLTIATEDFVYGGAFYPPGASLFPAGFPPSYGYDVLGYTHNYSMADMMATYANEESDVIKNVTEAAAKASQWIRLENAECKREYLDCSGLKHHRNLILVAEKPGGWTRDQMWHLRDNQTNLWNKYVPPDEPNHLFFDTSCEMHAVHEDGQPPSCNTNCFKTLAGSGIIDFVTSYEVGDVSIDGPDWQYSFLEFLDDFNSTELRYSFNDMAGHSGWSPVYNAYYQSAFLPGALDLTIKYCLAEPLDRICRIGLSPMLLLGVTICVVIKTCTAIVITTILVRRGQTPLVTLGDAIASFIETPDPATVGLCSLGQDDVRRTSRDRHTSRAQLSSIRQWQPLRRRRGAVVPILVWVTSYSFFAVGIGICAFFFRLAYHSTGFSGSFFESDQNPFVGNPFTFFDGVITANSPQLLLSFCYLAYDNLFTRLQMAREWALFGEECRPLRVTDPHGEQYATYRLQLPYKYSLPLIGASILLHWLLSNIIYLFVSIGGYYDIAFYGYATNQNSSLAANTAVAIGFSTYSLLAMLIVSSFLIGIPILLSLKRLSPNMTNIGSNSFALSAACHVSRLSLAAKSPEYSTTPYLTESSRHLEISRLSLDELIIDASSLDEIEMQHLAITRESLSRYSLASEQLTSDGAREEDSDGPSQRSLFRNLARSKIRWGVIRMPPEWYAEYEGEGVVEHLSFGVEEDNVQAPVSGRLYA